jgi:membrane-associated phospholipid phosphatase
LAQSALEEHGAAEPATRSAWRHPALVTVYFILAAILLGALSFYVHTIPLDPLDVAISHAVQSFDPPWLDLFMRTVSEPGYPPQVYVLVVWIFLVLWLGRLKWEAVTHAFGTIGIGTVGLAIKVPVDRPRPSPNLFHVWNPGLDGGKMSFPAGHVESYVVIFGFLIFLLVMLGKPSALRMLEIISFGALIALIGISRVYSGEHWASDSVGGYLLGSDWLIVTIYFYNWGKRRFFRLSV